MKIRATIHSFGYYNNGNGIFISAWKRFLDRNYDKLRSRFEFVFINNNIDDTYFSQLADGYPIINLSARIPPPFDTESNYIGISSGLNSNADYLMRIDHDAFPSVDSLNALADGLEENPDVTFASASNFPRSVFHHQGDDKLSLDCSSAGEIGKSTFPWDPWGLPTNNGDLFIFKKSFFQECDYAYHHNSFIANRRNRKETPFHSQVLGYHTICQLLGKSPRPDLEDKPIYIDGGLRSDFWTIMCQSPNMKMAGIVDNLGNSFCRKNHVVTQYNSAKDLYNSSKDVVDTIDVAWKHEISFRAPYWHLGNGYLVEWYFDPRAQHFKPSWNHFKPHFTSESFGNYVAHFAIVQALTKAANDTAMISSLHSQFRSVLKHEWGVNLTKLDTYCDDVLNFYADDLAEYL